MKKLLAFILCLTMAMGTVAFAEEVTGTELNKDVLEGQTTVSLTIDPEANEFVVVIPASVTIDPDTKKGSAEIVLKSGWKLPAANGLQVKLISAKNEITQTVDGYARFWLKDDAGNEKYYHILVGTSTTTFKYNAEGYTVLRITKGSNDSSVDKSSLLTFEIPESLPTTPGEYTDVLTFAVTLN